MNKQSIGENPMARAGEMERRVRDLISRKGVTFSAFPASMVGQVRSVGLSERHYNLVATEDYLGVMERALDECIALSAPAGGVVIYVAPLYGDSIVSHKVLDGEDRYRLTFRAYEKV